MAPEAFRDLAAQIVDASADYLASLDDRRTTPAVSGAETATLFDGPLPEVGIGEAVVDDLVRIADACRAGTGRLFPYVVGPGEPVAAAADLFASVLNQNATSWRSAPAAAVVERTVVRWLAEAIGCAGFEGSLTSGGSSANLMGLALARESRAPANETGAHPCVVYASTEVHMSVPKAVALLGIGRANLRLVPVDDAFRIDVGALETAIAKDERAGCRGIAIVASAGTIATGAIDPLARLAEVARDHDLWLHVDGAYGAPAALVEPDRFAGLADADSISLDAHKWLYQPFDVSVLLHRDPRLARRTFAHTDDYVRPMSDEPLEGLVFFEESIELSRRFRALKLWTSLRYHGLRPFREAIAADLRHARLLAQLVQEEPSLELLAPVELSAVCFRSTLGGSADALDRRNADLLREVNARGRVALSNATIDEAFALRACFVNHRTTDDDVLAIVEEVLAASASIAGSG